MLNSRRIEKCKIKICLIFELHHRCEDRDGTNYITTGAGMALSAPALERLMSCSSCDCRTPDSPDDMSLGSWFRSLRIQPTLCKTNWHDFCGRKSLEKVANHVTTDCHFVTFCLIYITIVKYNLCPRIVVHVFLLYHNL